MKIGGVWIVLVLSGCSLTSSLSGGTSSPSQSTMPSSTPTTSSTSSTQASASDKLVMPDLMGKTPDEANAILRAAGFSTEVEVNRRALECIGAARVPGRINCQTPDAGRPVHRSAIIGVTVHEERQYKGVLVRAQIEKMHGMTIEEAKAYLKRMGHDGEVRIGELQHWSDACGVGKVCEVEPSDGLGIHHRVSLMLNASSESKPAITLPD